MPVAERPGRGHAARLETKLGLDLQGGLRIEYQVLPAEGKTPDPRRPRRSCARSSSTASTSPASPSPGRRPGQRPDHRRDAGHPERGPDPQPRRHHGPPRLRPARPDADRAGPELGATIASDATLDARSTASLFSGDQVAAASDRRRPDGPADGRLHAQGRGQGPVRRLHRGPRRRLLRDRPRRQGHQRPGRSTSSIPSGQVQISQGGIGGYPLAEAQNLVTILQFGQLPFPIEELANTTVSPTLGEAFLHQSLLAGADRDPDGHLLHGRPLPAARRRRQRRPDLLRAGRLRAVPARSR